MYKHVLHTVHSIDALTQMKTIDRSILPLTILLIFDFIITIPQKQPLGHSACSCQSVQPSGGGKKGNYVHSQLHKWDKSFDLTLIVSYIYIYSQMKK